MSRIRGASRSAARRRARRTLRRLGRTIRALRGELGAVRKDVYRGVVVREAGQLAVTMAAWLAGSRARRRQRTPMAAAASAFAIGGLVAASALLLWDERRRVAVRRRLDDVVGGVSASRDRVSSPVPMGMPGER